MQITSDTVTAKQLQKANDQAIYSKLYEQMLAQKDLVQAAYYKKKLKSKRSAAECQALYNQLLAKRELMNQEWNNLIRPK